MTLRGSRPKDPATGFAGLLLFRNKLLYPGNLTRVSLNPVPPTIKMVVISLGRRFSAAVAVAAPVGGIRRRGISSELSSWPQRSISHVANEMLR